MQTLLTIDAAAVRTGEPARRLRHWCATGALDCDRYRGEWSLSEDELDRVPRLSASRRRIGADRRAVALALPGPLDLVALAREVAGRLRLDRRAITVRRLAVDRQEYAIAAWPELDDPTAMKRLAALADDLDGELIERPAAEAAVST